MPIAPLRGDGNAGEPSGTARRSLLRALGAVAPVAALGTGCTTPASSSAYELPPEAAPAAPAGEKRGRTLDFGLAYSDTLPWMSDADLGRALDDAVGLGVSWIRADLAWTNIQPDSPSQYLWERFDRVADAARQRKLKVLATLGFTPRWARDLACADKNQSCPPASEARFARFVTEAVTRYARRGVRTWQIWNEPNISRFWPEGADPARYAGIARAVSAAVRAVDPGAFLLLGGLANIPTTDGGRRLSAVDFLDRALDHGAGERMDAISFHPFTTDLLFSTKTGDSPYERITGARRSLSSVLARHRRTDLEIWLTETGAPTHGPGTIADSEHPGVRTTHATHAHQARIAADVITAADRLTAVTKVFWYAHRDTEPPSANGGRHHYYGLIEHTGAQKPAYSAYRDAIAAYRAAH
ncbi:cellulase family glycosylhydrolase [Streptomyces sp. NPDC056039]|uniref:cellulase family glycosylhydrolase n=1 Tax=Streptomyces sp. NPDC056039 TaxID=3345687 RepID=UPI0035DA28DD